MRSPAAVDRNDRAGDRRGFVTAEERDQGGDFLDGDETLGRLRGEEHVAHHRLLADATRPGLLRYLRLDEWREHIAGTDGVDGDPVLGRLERRRLGQAGDTMLGGDIGALE